MIHNDNKTITPNRASRAFCLFLFPLDRSSSWQCPPPPRFSIENLRWTRAADFTGCRVEFGWQIFSLNMVNWACAVWCKREVASSFCVRGSPSSSYLSIFFLFFQHYTFMSCSVHFVNWANNFRPDEKFFSSIFYIRIIVEMTTINDCYLYIFLSELSHELLRNFITQKDL